MILVQFLSPVLTTKILNSTVTMQDFFYEFETTLDEVEHIIGPPHSY